MLDILGKKFRVISYTTGWNQQTSNIQRLSCKRQSIHATTSVPTMTELFHCLIHVSSRSLSFHNPAPNKSCHNSTITNWR